MIILRKYHLEKKEGSELLYVKSEEESRCPFCKGKFCVIGSRKRVLYGQDAQKYHLLIRRLRCKECNRISHELPDIVVPYKRYEFEQVFDIIETLEDKTESYCPAENSTIHRWKKWINELLAFIKEIADKEPKKNIYLRSLSAVFFCYKDKRLKCCKRYIRYLVNRGIHTRFT